MLPESSDPLLETADSHKRIQKTHVDAFLAQTSRIQFAWLRKPETLSGSRSAEAAARAVLAAVDLERNLPSDELTCRWRGWRKIASVLL